MLAAQIEERPEALRELRTFPLGVAYLWEQWSMIDQDLSRGTPLLGSTRSLCYSLLGKKHEHVLRNDPTATRWFLALAGMMYGEKTTVDDVLALLGTDPPEWMSEAEFVIRATRLRSRGADGGGGPGAHHGLRRRGHGGAGGGQWDHVNEVADRDIGLDAVVAALDVTPAGMSLASAIDKAEKSCLAAIRRLQAGRAPGRPDPKRGPKKAESRRGGAARPDRSWPGGAGRRCGQCPSHRRRRGAGRRSRPGPPDDGRRGGAADGGQRWSRTGGGKARNRTHFRVRPGRTGGGKARNRTHF